ncbi:carbohydrate kinase family protein [Nonomuraea rubra]|uniref:carbohydrate kinase family protein n=1 Tax=Nonomuraea rubra TaxID=46180 RepID=UPI0036160415
MGSGARARPPQRPRLLQPGNGPRARRRRPGALRRAPDLRRCRCRRGDQGRDGALCFGPEESWSARGPRLDVVDTTGAGDALAGAFTGSWIRGRSLADSLRAGVAAASLCVSHLGSRAYLDAGTGIETLARDVTLDAAPHPQGIR